MSSLSEASRSPSQITVKLFDGKEMTVSTGTTGAELAAQIASSLGKAAIAVKINGEIRDLSTEIHEGERIEIITKDSKDALHIIRHDAAHVMAEAVQLLYPGTQVTIGPSIENGFYYDFHKETPFTPEDLQKIEAKMREIISADKKFIREEWTREQAVKFFKDKGELFKVELIENLPPSETISIYRQGDWLDLCRGPHLPSTGKVGTAFKLMSVAGAYWRGDSNRPMLQRIYGTAWRDQKELDSYLHMLEEAERRDHRRLGKEMNLFHLQEEAQGSVFWHPKGFTIYRELEAYIRRKIYADGYVEVKTPQLMNSKFWEKSGHWSKFRENMFVVPDIIPNTDEDGPVFKEEPKEFMALKPMNCPAHIQIFKQGIKSYRDLPIRMAEMGCCHRNEAHGALHGLMRVRQMTQDDAHIFCREDQIGEEVKRFVALFKDVYSDFGFTNIKLLLATRPDNRAGDDATWDKAEKAMADALNELDLEFDYAPGEGAFYGPKYEFHLTDSIGRSWQCGTCQLDFVLPERLDASYIGVDGQKYRPVMIHRAVFGTFERFIGLLIESTGGRLPLWLAPVQAVVTTITNESNAYAETVQKALLKAGLRAEIDCRNEKIGYKIREHSLEKIPVLVVVGKKEAETNSVALRYMGDTEQVIISLDEAIERLVREAQVPKRK